MPNRSHLIKNPSLVRYTRGNDGIKAALAKADTECHRIDRDPYLRDYEKGQRKAEARTAMEATIRQHQADMDEAAADHRSWSVQHTDDAPSGEEAMRRSYYSVRAQAELAHLPEADALALVQRMAATGDRERGQEWVAAARGRVPAGALRALERQVESVDAAGARHWGAAVDAIQGQLGWHDHHVSKLMDRVGKVTADPERDEQTGAPLPWPGGQAPEAPLDTRILDLWARGLDGHAGAAFQASIAADGQWSDLAAALPYGGTEGYDATGDEQAQGDPQGQTDAPADPQADHSDAEVDA